MAETHDIVIAGAGPVGAVCALALRRGGRVPLLLEARAADAPVNDRRTLALSHGSRLILERLGVWSHVTDATPIMQIHVSHRGGLGRALLDAAEEGLPALGHVLSYGALARAVATALTEAAIDVRHATPVTAVEPGATFATIRTAGNPPGELHARLAVIADGGKGSERGAALFSHDYNQHAVVAHVTTERPHRNMAYERFTPDGPVALLPDGKGYALVWVNSPAEAARRVALAEEAFLAELQAQFGHRQGRFLSATARGMFPLKLDYRGIRAGEHVARVGNAAQTLHPVAGQGFNLGLRDAWELAQSCIETPLEALGAHAQLQALAARRRSDALPGIGFTDLLVRTFSNDHPLLRHLRGAGLMALQVFPPARHFVARRMLFGRHG